MTKTLIDVDTELLAQSQQILATTTKKETINKALREIVRLAAIKELCQLGQDGIYDGLIGTPE